MQVFTAVSLTAVSLTAVSLTADVPPARPSAVVLSTCIRIISFLAMI